MNLFGKKKSNSNGAPSEGGEEKREMYFEAFGSAVNELRFYRGLAIGLVALAVYLVITLRILITKPPLVIRVNEMGHAAAIKDLDSSLSVTGPELTNFTQYFLQYFTAWNFYSRENDFTRAFEMMTQKCQQKLNDYLNSNGIENQIKTGQLKVKLTITGLVVEKYFFWR